MNNFEKGPAQVPSGIRFARGTLFAAVALVAVAGAAPESMPVFGSVFSVPTVEAAGPKCNVFKGKDRSDCEKAKQRVIKRMRQKQGKFVRSRAACAKSYRNFRREKPVWNKVRAFCVRNGNPRSAPYLSKLARQTGLYIPADCVQACGIAEGKTWYYTKWKNVCKD